MARELPPVSTVMPFPKATLAQYNNLTPELQRNPYRFPFTLYGAAKAVTVTQRPEYGIPGVVWDCGVVLANAVAATPARFHGKTILEVGAATGIAAAVAWHCGASLAVASDLPQVVVDVTRPAIQSFVREAGSVPAARRDALLGMPLTWGDAEETAALQALLASRLATGAVGGGAGAKKPARGAAGGGTAPAHWDFVLAADVSYQPNMFAALLECLKALVPGGTDAHEKEEKDGDPSVDDGKKTAPVPVTTAAAAAAAPVVCHTTLLFVYRRRVNADADMLAALRGAYVEVAATPGQRLVPSYPKDNLTLFEFRTAASVAAAPPAGPPTATTGGKKGKKGGK